MKQTLGGAAASGAGGLLRWSWRFHRLRTRLTAYSLALFALVLCGTMTAVYASIVRNAERVVSDELAASAVVFDRVWQLRSEQLESAASLLAHDFGFRAAVATRDAATIQSALQNLRRRVGMHVAFVVDDQGRVLAAEGDGATATAAAWLQQSADGAGSGVMAVQTGAHKVVAAPILAPTPLGQAVFASRIDAQELATLVRLSPIAFEPQLLVEDANGRWTGVDGLSRAELANAESALRAGAGAKPTAHKIGPWIEVVRPLQTLGGARAALLLRYPLAEALAPYDGLLALVLLFAVAGIGLLAAGAWVVAQEVTRPIGALSEAAERLERGEPADVNISGYDEIAALGQSFNSMAQGIARREAALESARDEAEAANRAKSEFLANMSHEIRTPLNGILGMAQVMELQDPPPNQARALKIIRNSGESLLAIINSILDLSRIEAGQMELMPEDFELVELAELTSAPFAALAAQKGLAFELDVTPRDASWRRADAQRLRQVLTNLLGNAVKFTEKGRVRLEVLVSPQGARFRVSDTGVGIPPERLAHIFERFAQADNSATRRFGGAGLGLAISREIASLMGGRLSVDSTEGQGSTFVFEVPLKRIAAPALESGAFDEQSQNEAPLRILVVDDNATNRQIVAALLEPAGVEVSLAEDGAQAVEAAASAAFDLILMDIQMPGMSGVEAARAIRAGETGARAPILALTANVMTHQVEEYLAAGMDGVLPKPIQAESLYAAVEQALNPAPMAAQGVA